MSIEEREAAIRQERARRLSRHPGLSPQEKAALQEWDERDRLMEGADALVRELDAQRQTQRAQTSAATYAWKSDVRYSCQGTPHAVRTHPRVLAAAAPDRLPRRGSGVGVRGAARVQGKCTLPNF